MLRPGGVFVFDTVNRTFLSYLLAILVAESRIAAVPPHTHDWRLFITPEELRFLCHQNHMKVVEVHGFLPRPTVRNFRLTASEFSLGKSTSVSYIGYAIKQDN